jgi:serine/threonine-protein kinase
MWEGVPDVQVIQSLAHGNVPAPSSVAANVPPLLEAICKKALAVRCGERYESAAAMQADLERAIVGLAVETDARQVGKLVAAWFGEPRAATKKAIEAQLKDQNASVVSFAPEDRDAPAAAANSISGERSRSERAEPSGALQAEARRRRLRSRWIAAATFTSLAIAAALVSRRDGHPGIAPSVHAGPGPIRDAPPSPSASSTAAPVKDQVVHVFFQATPPAAKLYWDDAPLPGNPFEGDLPSDSARHTIRAELGGYASQTHVAALSGPLRLTLKLEGTPEHHRAAPGSGAGHAVGVATTTTVPAPRSGNAAVASAPPRDRSSSPPCTPPFFFDSAGIKHVKPECLD